MEKASGGRAGYAIAGVVNAALLWAINIWPGWQAVPFLTPATAGVVGPVNRVLVAGVIVNVVLLLAPFRLVKALGDLAVLVIGLPVMFRLWEVFPFDFGDGWPGWPVVVRVLLVLGIAGQIIGIIVGLVELGRALAGSGANRRRPRRL
ncbi:hypothetical protein [Pseudarthrobacter sulfonivorans]|uniref:hypothetical protein n=1 Tax=Pseudarthrobacter sulfonivorans TaxID=121292 RepID=UPI00278303C5|nr:hypothetical protein [Pseudarthrobacter sulfonivorans]MDP9997945.1 hypothetical protein [Pseudarthrobacter sulfonivorans]